MNSLFALELSEWARHQGISYRTAGRWFRAGTLPVPAKPVATGTILVTPATTEAGQVAVHARVSSSDQKSDVAGQVARLVAFANARGLAVSRTVWEVDSGLNRRRLKLLRLLSDPAVQFLVVEHRDRLMSFGSEYAEAALGAQGGRLVVADAGEVKDDLVQDMLEVLTSLCTLYGRRSARNRARRALKGVEDSR